MTALMHAAWRGRTDTCVFLLARGADLDAADAAFGQRALCLAARRDRTGTAAALLVLGSWLHSAAFDFLRTEKKIGYVAGAVSGAGPNDRARLVVYAMGAKAPAFIENATAESAAEDGFFERP